MKDNILTLNKINKFIKNYNMLFVMIGMFIVCSIISPVFMTPKNILNLLQQNAIYGIMAIGMAYLLISGAIDLSVGANVALTGVIAGKVLLSTGSYFLTILVGILVGVAIGFANGFLVTKLKVNYFIATLGTMTMINGFVLIITGGRPITGIPAKFGIIGMGKIGIIPISMLIWITLAVVMQFILKYTKYGQYVYAVGGNERAAWLSGININIYRTLTFILTGVFASCGALVLLSRTSMAAVDAGTGYELKVIAACIVGGVSLDGGKGDVANSIFGVIILGLVLNILQLSGVSSYYQNLFTGAIIIAAVSVSNLSKIKRD